jgi:hypothetical protein
MKKIGLLYIVFILMSGKGFTQTTPRTIFYSGIYKTAQDFKDRKLSFSVNCDSAAGKIKLHHFFPGKYVNVIRNKTNYRLSKDSIFGYRDCKGNDYRFFENYSYEYQIVEDKSIVIYIALLTDPTYSGKGIKVVPTYFFSKTLGSEVLPLTINNLKMVFAGDIKFCNMLDGTVNSIEELTTYDYVHKMYKINYLLSLSI